METIYVIDAGVLFSDWIQRSSVAKYITTLSILEEIKNRPSIQRAESMISTGRLLIKEPTSESFDKVRKAASSTGDISVLSEQDMELISLAFDESVFANTVIVVSSDLAVLNTAKKLGLSVIDPKERMTHEIQWIMSCPACGHISEDSAEVECVVCGTKMKRKAKKSRRI